MTFRHRITLVATAAVAVAVLVASALTYLLVSDQLHRQIDNSLRDTALGVQRGIAGLHQPGRLAVLALPPGVAPDRLRQILRLDNRRPRAAEDGRSGRLLLQTPKMSLGQDRGVIQLLGVGGRVLVSPAGSATTLPVDARARKLVGSGGSGSAGSGSAGSGSAGSGSAGSGSVDSGARGYFSDTHIGSDHLRVLTAALPPGTPARAIQIARSLNEVDHTLSNLRLILMLVALGGIAVAALLGLLVSRAAIAPVRRLTEAAEHVAKTQDLARRIPSRGGGELSRLAVSFNAMLDALEHSMRALDASVSAQRQLVADASHELRTPITSLRANIEVLQQSPGLPERERERLLSDVVEQLEELTALINDVIELARGDEPSPVREDVRFDLLVAEAIERARLHAPWARIEEDLRETLLVGDPARLDRAVKNLLDNALKFGPREEPIEVALSGGELTVRDRGPGIAASEMPHVFDRFYRGPIARSLPGSGLGLAIVRQVAEAHGGSVTAETAPGGGTLMRLRLPVLHAEGIAEEAPASVAPG
jgi:two-component system, OmpR family, sensor histidine kinase MprB